ncbi:type II toxin-antitoxin system RelE/ParE family toxin [Neorhizobium galegae]|uniref:Toxin n=1 Tax=Neorhizobium galegae TaxID=399 RepID=A0A6A1TWU4_NEOGA|nr:type II toxin-antitoxin system RelE/ParE family toxin [Neorhizobium galegae]KAB1087984.1 type II toxin-antitoxin system RelE/ParE family toxin [Neorhizobium galegae]
MPEYRLTSRAESEIVDIIRYGIETFGVLQAQHYVDELTHCFELLVENPRMGGAGPDFGESVRRHIHARHIVLYEINAPGILILAVVHVRSVVRLIKS